MSENKTKSRKSARVICLFLISIIFVGIAASFAIVGYNYIGNRNFKETFYSVSSLKVNNKIRILQLSDLHDCSYGNDNEKIINRVSKLNPDIIICTGDMIDSDAESTQRVASFCKALADIAPSYYIYGNNEVEKYYDVLLNQEDLDKKFGFDNENRDPSKLLDISDALEEKLEAIGVKVLKNETDKIVVGKTAVDIHGVLTSNPSAFWSYDGKSFDEYMYSDESNLKIMAIHEPVIFTAFEPDSWGDLVFAGDAHGGLIRVPIIGPLYTNIAGFFPERKGHFVYGRFEVQGRPLIVSAGLENKNVLRINNPPEIVIVDVNKF